MPTLFCLVLCLGQSTGPIELPACGASLDPRVDSTAAIERAVADAGRLAAAQTGWHAMAAVHVPAGQGKAYRITRPIFVPDGVEIVGDGWSSSVRMDATYHYPCFVIGVDDPGLTPADSPDLFGFMDATMAPRKGVRYGFSTRRGRCLQLVGHCAFGRLRDDGSWDYWGDVPALTIDVAVDSWPAGLQAPVLGLGESGAQLDPRPWIIYKHEHDPGITAVAISTSVLDRETPGGNFVWHCSIPPGSKRVAFQWTGQTLAAWADGRQVHVAPQRGDPPAGARLRPAADWPLVISAQGMQPSDGSPVTPFTLAGFHIEAAPRYRVGAEGSPQTRIDGQPITDAWAYVAHDPVSTLAWMPMDRPATRWLPICTGRDQPGAMLVISQGQGGGRPNAVRNLDLAGSGPGLLVGAVLRFRAHAVRIQSGSAPAIASLPIIISYPVTITDCDLSGESGIQAYRWLGTIDRPCFSSFGRSAIKARGSSLRIISPEVHAAGPHAYAAFELLPAMSTTPLTTSVVDAMVDTEGDQGLDGCCLEAWGNLSDPSRLIVDGLAVAQVGRQGKRLPVVRLRGDRGGEYDLRWIHAFDGSPTVQVDQPGPWKVTSGETTVP